MFQTISQPSPTFRVFTEVNNSCHLLNVQSLLHQPYEGPDDVCIGDGTGLQIIHTGIVNFSPSFTLSNVLFVPSIKQN